MKAPRGGFTLVELLIVIVIIGILVGILIIAGGPIMESARRLRCSSKLKNLQGIYMAYVTDHRRFPPLIRRDEYDFGDQDYNSLDEKENALVINEGRFDAGFGPLVWHRRITEPMHLVCPAVELSDWPWWRDSALADGDREDAKIIWNRNQPNPDPVALAEEARRGEDIGNVTTRACYCIRPYLYPHVLSQVEAEGIRAFMADNIGDPEMVEYRHEVGVNVAYLDGHIRFIEHEDLLKQVPVMELWEILDDAK